MKIVYRRTHTVRPVNYESVQMVAQIEIDTDSEAEEDLAFHEGFDSPAEIGMNMAEYLDGLLDSDVDRTLRLDGEHINDSHLWVFYGRD